MKIGTQLNANINNKITYGSFNRLRILLFPIILTAALCGGTAWYIVDTYKSYKKIQTQDIEIINLSNQIVYLDEVLTSSARLAATSGNVRWKKRYFEYVPQLDETIAEIEKLLLFVDSSGISNTDEANNQLIAMEEKAFDLVSQGKLGEATSLLLSPEYEKQKSIYALGIKKTTEILQSYVNNSIKNKSQLTYSMLVALIVSSGILLIVWVFVLQRMKGYIQAINDMENIISQTSSEITLAVNRQEANIAEQTDSISKTTSTVDQLGASSRKSAVQAEESAKKASEALSLSASGAQTVEQTMSGMENLKEKVRAIAEQIVNLSEQTGQIATVSDLVGDLANQTNMLALNAAVEAARAGEHGKGFGVVASEIRKLADESRKSANKINNLVTEIQDAMSSAVMVTDEGKKTADASIELAQGTAQSLVGVKDAIENVFANAQQISETAKVQAVGIQEILASINALNLGAMDTAEGMNEVKASATQLQDFTEKLKAIV